MKRSTVISLLCAASIIIAVCIAMLSLNRHQEAVLKSPVADKCDSFLVREAGDSLYVDGVFLDGKPLAIPLSFIKEDFQYKYDDDGEEFREERLRNPRRVEIRFTEPVNAYSVSTVLHPDENFDNMGMAEWTFEKEGRSLAVNTGFQWNWKDDIIEKPDGEPAYEGEIYRVNPTSEMVQGLDSIVLNTPFCFKDVDFDGDQEICFRSPGYNRIYYNIYKIISPTKAVLLTAKPYNNIGYALGDEATYAVFNYTDKTIEYSSGGASNAYSHTYVRRKVVKDILDPMQHLEGHATSYHCGGSDEYFFKDAVCVRYIQSFDASTQEHQFHRFECDYFVTQGKLYTLQSVRTGEYPDDKTVLYLKP